MSTSRLCLCDLCLAVRVQKGYARYDPLGWLQDVLDLSSVNNAGQALVDSKLHEALFGISCEQFVRGCPIRPTRFSRLHWVARVGSCVDSAVPVPHLVELLFLRLARGVSLALASVGSAEAIGCRCVVSACSRCRVLAVQKCCHDSSVAERQMYVCRFRRICGCKDTSLWVTLLCAFGIYSPAPVLTKPLAQTVVCRLRTAINWERTQCDSGAELGYLRWRIHFQRRYRSRKKRTPLKRTT